MFQVLTGHRDEYNSFYNLSLLVTTDMLTNMLQSEWQVQQEQQKVVQKRSDEL